MSREDTEESGDDCGANKAAPRQSSRARARIADVEPVPPNALASRITTTLARIEETEDLLAGGNSPRRTASLIAKRWDIGRRQAQEYVRAVHTRWLAEAQSEDRESKRARMRAMVMATYQKAMDRERGIVVNVGDWKQEVEYVADPDLRAAGNMLELACRLDGLLEQPKAGAGAAAFAEAAMSMLAAHYFGSQDEVQARVVEAQPEALESGDDK